MDNLAHIKTISDNISTARDCVIIGNYIYIADSDVGIVKLHIYDNNDVDSVAISGVWGIESWYDNIIVLAGTELLFYSLDLRLRGSLSLIPTYGYRGMQRHQDTLYIASYTTGAGITTVDLNQRVVNHTNLGDTLQDVSVNANRSLIATATFGSNIIIYNAAYQSVKSIPLVGQYSNAVRFQDNDVLYAGIYAVADGLNTIAAYDPISGDALASVTTLDNKYISTMYGITIHDGALFVSAGAMIYIVAPYLPSRTTTTTSSLGIMDGKTSLRVGGGGTAIVDGGATKTTTKILSTSNKYLMGKL